MPIPKIGAYVVFGRSDEGFLKDVTRFQMISRNRRQENVLQATGAESGGMLMRKIARRKMRRALQNAARGPAKKLSA